MLQLSGELDAARISVKDLEQKLSLLEHSNLANTDTLLHGVQERHEKEIINLRSKVESVTAKLTAKVCIKGTLSSGKNLGHLLSYKLQFR
jgi:hypothetical protein